jgi:FkbM family methyltransferase
LEDTVEEPWLVEHIVRASESCDIAIDIGANTGDVSRLLAERFRGVLAVEPDPRAFAELLGSVPKNVYCHNAAATRKNGAVTLHMRPESVQSSLLHEHPIGAADQADAPVVDSVGVNGETLDFLLFVARQRFGDFGRVFVKVDVEGAEGDVIGGATDKAFSDAAWLIEVHDREVEVGVELQRLGYDGITITPHPMPSAHKKHFWIYAEPPE